MSRDHLVISYKFLALGDQSVPVALSKCARVAGDGACIRKISEWVQRDGGIGAGGCRGEKNRWLGIAYCTSYSYIHVHVCVHSKYIHGVCTAASPHPARSRASTKVFLCAPGQRAREMHLLLYCVSINSACAREVEHWLTDWISASAAAWGWSWTQHTRAFDCTRTVCIFIYIHTHTCSFDFIDGWESRPDAAFGGKISARHSHRIKKRQPSASSQCCKSRSLELHELMKNVTCSLKSKLMVLDEDCAKELNNEI